MASSVSGQDESNPALWLATRAGKMELSCPLRTTHHVPQEKFPRKPFNEYFIDQACLVKMAGYWPRSFFVCLWTSTPFRSINTQKKELGQYPAILNSHLVNNPYKLVCPLTWKITTLPLFVYFLFIILIWWQPREPRGTTRNHEEPQGITRNHEEPRGTMRTMRETRCRSGDEQRNLLWKLQREGYQGLRNHT